MKKLNHYFLFLLVLCISTVQAQDTWLRKADLTGNARKGATGFAIGGLGYIAGGYDGAYYNDLWEYDTASNVWTQKADLPAAPRMGAVAFANSTTAWFGTGYDGTYMNDMWRYDQATNTWTQVANFSGGARQGAVSFTIGTAFFAGTGYNGNFLSDFYSYDPITDTWTTLTAFPGGGRIHAAAFSNSTTGYIGLGFGAGYLKDLWAFNPALATWTRKTDFPATARGLGASFSIAGKGIVAVGDDGINLLTETWEYNPQSDAWSQLSSIHAVGRELPAFFSIGNQAYIMGGSDNGATYYRDFWQWNPNYCDLTAVASVQHVACTGDASGAVDLTITGIHNPFTVNWSSGDNTEDLSNLTAGNYRYTITDTVNCTLTGVLRVDDGLPIHFGRDTSYWSTTRKAGGAADDKAFSIVTDPSDGSVTVTGTFKSSATFNSTTLNSHGGTDIFIARYNAGGVLQWVRQIGGTIDDEPAAVATDSAGNLFVTGRFGDMAFFGSQQINGQGEYDIFLARYTKTGNLVWVRTAGGTLTDQPRALFTDRSGNCYLTGSFQGFANFQGTNLMSLGGNDIFTAKFNNSGVMQWVSQAGSVTTETGTGIGADLSGNVLVTGNFQNTLTVGATTLTSAGATDVLLIKYDRYGSPLWAVNTGGIQADQSKGLFVNNEGQAIVAGTFIGTAQFGASTLTSAGAGDVFTAAFNTDGSLAWANRAGGSGDDAALALTPWKNGDCMVAGRFSGTATFGTKTFTAAGGSDLFMSKVDALGQFRFTVVNGGQGNDEATTVNTDANGKVFAAGSFNQNITFGTNILLSSGGSDAFFTSFVFDALYVAPEVTHVNCPGGADGAISYEVAGGRPPYTFLWDNGLTAQNISGLPTGSYQLTITDANNCSFDTTFTITSLYLPPTPPTSATVDRQGFCADDPGNIVLTAIGGTQGEVFWYEDALGTIPLGPGVTLSLASPDTTTTYYARRENACDTTVSVQVTVEVKNLPQTPDLVSASSTDVCAENEAVILTATGGSGDILRWYSGTCGGTPIGEGNNYNVPFLTANTTFYGRYESPFCGVSDCKEVSISVRPQPEKVTSVTASKTEICFNEQGILQLTATGGSGSQLVWTSGSCGGTVLGTINPLPINPPADTTTYFVYWQNSCGASDCDSVTINVKPAPVAPDTVIASETVFCQGSVAQLTLTAIGGSGDMVKWYQGYCEGTYVDQGTSINIAAPQATTTYYAQWENSCDASICKYVTVTVNNNPTVTLTPLAPWYCESNNTAISIQGSPSTGSGSYMPTPGLIPGPNGTATFTPSAAGVGSYTITYSYTDGNGCSGSASINTEVKPLPVVWFNGLASEYCLNDPAAPLYGSLQPLGEFTPVTGLSNITNGTATFTPILAGAGTHTITYSYTDNFGCQNDSSETVVVHPLPVVTFSGLPTTACVNDDPYTLLGQPATNGYFAGLGVFPGVPGQAFFDPSVAGVGGPYSVAYIHTDANGCQNAATALVTVNGLPEVGFSGLAESYCADIDSVLLIGDQAPNGVFSGNVVPKPNGTAWFKPKTVGPGTYDITYTVTEAGCSDSVTQTTTVLQLPVISTLNLDPAYCRNDEPVEIEGSEKPFGHFYGPGITPHPDGTATFDPSEPNGTGPHLIIYEYENLEGCTNRDTTEVTINELTPVSFTGLGPFICVNETAQLTGSEAPAGTFSGNPGVSSPGNGTGEFDASVVGVGVWDVIYTFTDANQCESADTMSVIVQPIPVPTITDYQATYCLDAPNDTLHGSGFPFGGFEPLNTNWLDDLGIGLAVFKPGEAGVGTHDITYTYSDIYGCTADTTYTVEVVAPPVVTISGLDPEYCADNDPVTITGSPSAPGNAMFNGTGFLDNGDGTADFDPAAIGPGGPYIVTYTYTDENGCSSFTRDTTLVNPLPTAPANLFTNHNLYCSGQYTEIQVSAPITTSDSVRWYSGGCNGTYLGTTTLNNTLTLAAPTDSTWLYAHAVNGCGETECDSLLIEVIPLPVAPDSVYSDTTGYCYGTIQSITLTATGGFGDVLSWHVGSCDGVQLGTTNEITIGSPMDTTWYFAKWSSNCGVSLCDSVRVDVIPLPVTPDSLTVDTNNYCIGTVNQIVLTAFGGLGDTVQWYTKSCGDSLVGTDNPLTLTAPDTNETYYARYKNQCMVSYCTSIEVIVRQNPETPDSLYADQNDFCSGEFGVINLFASGGYGNQVRWFEGSCTGTELGIGNPLLITAPTDTTTYFARWETTCGESECAEFDVNVKPLPAPLSAVSISPGVVCPDQVVDITLSATGTLNQGDTVYWYANDPTGDLVGTGTSLVIPNPGITTIYFAVNRNSCGESNWLNDTLVVDAPLPPSTMIPDTNYLCKGFSTTINIQAEGGNGTTLTWYGESCGGTVLGTGTQLIVTAPDTTTWYYATYTNSCGESDCDSVPIHIIPNAIAPDTLYPDINDICIGSVEFVTLTAVGGYGDTVSPHGQSIRWFLRECGGLEVGTGPVISIPAPVVTTKYLARWENSCSVSECKEVTIVVNTPVAPDTIRVDTNNFCPGDVTVINLYGTGGNGTATKWATIQGADTVIIGSGQHLALAAPMITTRYFVRKENYCGVSPWAWIDVIVNLPESPVLIEATHDTICARSGMEVAMWTLGGSGDTLLWWNEFDPTLIKADTLRVSPDVTTTYYALYETVCGQTSPVSFTLTVIPKPVVVINKALDSICELLDFPVAVDTALDYASVQWTTTGRGWFDDATALSTVYHYGNYDVVTSDTVLLILTAAGNSPCADAADSITLIINPQPVFTLFPDAPAICRDSAVMLTTEGELTYQYRWEPGTGLDTLRGDTVMASPFTTTGYQVIATTLQGCSDTIQFEVLVRPRPFLNLGQDQYLFTCEPVQLDAGGGDGFDYYLWDNNSQARVRTISETGTYWVTVGNEGCEVTDTIYVQLCEGIINVPTAFSPNNDGVNEIFRPVSTDPTIAFKMYIYDRHGMLIYQTDDLEKGWDGKFNGESCPAGIYVYFIVFRGEGTVAPGPEQTLSGQLFLAR